MLWESSKLSILKKGNKQKSHAARFKCLISRVNQDLAGFSAATPGRHRFSRLA